MWGELGYPQLVVKMLHDILDRSYGSCKRFWYRWLAILEQRLGTSPDRLLRSLNRPERSLYLVIGTPDAFQQAVTNRGRQFVKGI